MMQKSFPDEERMGGRKMKITIVYDSVTGNTRNKLSRIF